MLKEPLKLEKIAQFTNCKLVGDTNHLIHNVADLESATSQDASFLANPRYNNSHHKTQAGVIFVDEKTPLLPNKNYLLSTDPSNAFQILIDFLSPQRKTPSGFTGIHPTAIIHETAKIDSDCHIGPHAVIDEGVTIGKHTFIGAGSYIGPNTCIGTNCTIHPRVVIREDCIIGNRVILQPGAVIGSCGFGYLTDKYGKHTKLNQVGNVCIEDDVEIGANTTIDRSRFKSTIVKKGSKIDNLVQLGHGVEVGNDNIIVAQTGIAGSTKLGNHVVLAGQVAIAGHLELANGVTVAGKSGVTKSLSSGKYGGIPAIPIDEYNRTGVLLRNIKNIVNDINEINNKLKIIEMKNK